MGAVPLIQMMLSLFKTAWNFGSIFWNLPPELFMVVDVNLVAQSYPTLCDPVDCSLPVSSVHGIFQGRILEWVPFPSSGDLPNPGIEPTTATLVGTFFSTEHPWKPKLFIQFSSVAQSCPTLCDPMNCSTPGLPVHHQLLEFTPGVHGVSDAIQPSHPLSSPSPPAPEQYEKLFITC